MDFADQEVFIDSILKSLPQKPKPDNEFEPQNPVFGIARNNVKINELKTELIYIHKLQSNSRRFFEEVRRVTEALRAAITIYRETERTLLKDFEEQNKI